MREYAKQCARVDPRTSGENKKADKCCNLDQGCPPAPAGKTMVIDAPSGVPQVDPRTGGENQMYSDKGLEL